MLALELPRYLSGSALLAASGPEQANRDRPFGRVDCSGLLWLVNGDKLVELDHHRAVIETRGSARQTYRRKPVVVSDVAVPWELVD